jgi:hypothetical protein
MKPKYFILLLLIFALAMVDSDLFAQGCSQCRMVPKSDLDGGGQVANKLNTGILYLLAMPYLFLSVIGVVYRKPIIAYIKKRRATKKA